MNHGILNGVQTFAPTSREDLIEYAFNKKQILVAVNAEKILHATPESRNIINRNLGYPDGVGAVMALKQKGVQKVVKIPGCELWLEIIKTYYKDKTFYLVGGKEETIQETVSELKRQFSSIRILNLQKWIYKIGGGKTIIN